MRLPLREAFWMLRVKQHSCTPSLSSNNAKATSGPDMICAGHAASPAARCPITTFTVVSAFLTQCESLLMAPLT